MADFSKVALYYDLMTGTERRLVKDFGVIKFIVDKYRIKTALDAGCGTGVHTIILAKIGVEVIGVDSSAEILEPARTNALKAGAQPLFRKEYFEALPEEWEKKFDGIFCLANALVGVETMERLALSLKSFYRVLKPGGRAIIQLVNMRGFRRQNRRIIKISTEQNLTFIRFFDFEENDTRLNILILEHEMGEVRHTLTTQRILPITVEMLGTVGKMCQFSDFQYFSDMTLSAPFSPEAENLVAVLTR